MIRPTKHSHPDQTVISLSLKILRRLRVDRVTDYETMLKFAEKEVQGGKILFLEALSFLFVLGVVEYQKKSDVLEYIDHRTNDLGREL